MGPVRISLLSILLSAAVSTSALAHRFEVLLINSEPAMAQDSYDGFRLATRERDGHADEESDGHLGGLDVYINTPAKGETALAALAGGTFDLVAVTGALADDTALQNAIQNSGAVMVPVAFVTPTMKSEFLDPSPGEAFSTRFQAAENRIATPQANLSYIAARIIDLAVRPREGVSDRAALRAVIAKY